MISTRGRYALRVLLDIAEHEQGKPIPLGDIAARQNISEKYLESILVSLTRGGLLAGTRGKGGGYRLTRAPEEYTVEEILCRTEGTLSPVACLKEDAPACPREDACPTLPLWQGLQEAITTYLRGVTLADLLHPQAPPSAAPPRKI